MRASTESASYVFCLVESSRRPWLPPSLPQLPAAGRPRILRVEGDVWLVAADVPLQQYSKAAIEQYLRDLDAVSARAVAHEAMVAAMFKRWPVIPFKLFTIFTSDERAVGTLRRRLPQIRRLFDLIRDHEEWGVRFTIRPDGPTAPPAHVNGSGRDYLEAKRYRRLQSTREAEAARKQATAALNSLAALASRVRRQKPVATDLAHAVLEAAFLVPTRRSKIWRSSARTLGAKIAARGCRIEITGPWPPYNFVSARPS